MAKIGKCKKVLQNQREANIILIDKNLLQLFESIVIDVPMLYPKKYNRNFSF